MGTEDLRRIKIGDWIFEVKMVRALRVEEYGQPYDACSILTFNGNNCYIESQMTRSEQAFTNKDYQAFEKFLDTMDVSEVSYDRYRNGQRKQQRKAIGSIPQQKNIINFPQHRSS